MVLKKDPPDREYEIAKMIAHDRWTNETIRFNPKLIDTCRPLAKKIITYLEGAS